MSTSNNNIQSEYKININSAGELNTALEELNTRLDKVTRNATAWDAYKIIEVVHDKASFEAIKNKLPLFTSLVINTDPFAIGTTNYKPGDIVYRTSQYNFEHIPAERGGIFAPTKLTQSKKDGKWGANFTLTYDFLSTMPQNNIAKDIEPDEKGDIRTWTVDKNLKNFTLTGISVNAPSNIYGQIFEPSNSIINTTWSASFTGVDGVEPIIKMFNNKNEEVITDYSITSSIDEKTEIITYKIERIPSVVKQVVIK